MYAHPNHIPQPPHSAGLEYKGLRPKIDPAQVPSPIDTIEVDRQAWETKAYLTLPGTHAPLCTSDYVAIDQGNASPKFIRMSTWNIPSTSRLTADCKIPISAIIQPFADLDPREEQVPLVDLGTPGPARCAQCRAYINPWATWVSGGVRWKCNLCSHETEVSPEYFCNLDPNSYRLDHLQRPELNKGTVDFVVTSNNNYWAQHPPPRLSLPYFNPMPPAEGSRTPAPMDYIFAFDVSRDAQTSGFLQAACDSVRTVLYGGTYGNNVPLEASFPPASRVAILTFDSAIHFYDLSSDLAPMLVVGDLEEVFVPLQSGLFVSPNERRPSIEMLLGAVTQRFAAEPSSTSCLGSAIRACLGAMAGHGGHLVIFQATMPTIGAGALSGQPTEVEAFDTDKETTLCQPRDKAWLDIGDECAEEGVGVTVFLGPSQFIDVASIGAPSSLTGGELFFHPRFDRARDGLVLDSQLQRVMRRMQGYNCTGRVRCSKGLRVSRHYGNFTQRSPTDLEFGIMDADKGVSVVFEHAGGKIDPRSNVFVQFALLYTSVEGERRVRVINLALNVVELAPNVFQFADMETVLSHMAKEAMDNMKKSRTLIIREELTERCASVLLGYRAQCATGTRSTQLIIPEAFRALPAYTLALQKTKPLKARQVSADVRNYHMHRLLGMGARTLMFSLYPRLLALHDLDNQITFPVTLTDELGNVFTTTPMPSCMRDSYFFMESAGVYIIDNEEMTIFWVGSAASPQILKDLFGVEDVYSVDPHMHTLPTIDSTLSVQVSNILAHRFLQRGRTGKTFVVRQNLDAVEIEFSDMLVEDQNNGAMSYLDYLAVVHRQIANVLNGTSSSSPSTGYHGFRGSMW